MWPKGWGEEGYWVKLPSLFSCVSRKSWFLVFSAALPPLSHLDGLLAMRARQPPAGGFNMNNLDSRPWARFSGRQPNRTQWTSPIKVGEECASQEPGEINQKCFKLTQEKGDDQHRGFSEGKQTAEAHLGRPGQMDPKVCGFRCLCTNATGPCS